MLALTGCTYTPRPVSIDVPAHFPPLPIPADNPITEEKLELGRTLFFDPILSANGVQSCASCHQPAHGLASPKATDITTTSGLPLRNTPSLWNVGFAPFLMTEGGVPNLEAQALAPLSHAGEMQTNFSSVLDTLRTMGSYRILFHKAFGTDASVENIVKALACYQRSLVSATSYWDLYQAGDTSAVPSIAIDGYKIFNNPQIGCANCHQGSFYTDYKFYKHQVPDITKDLGLARRTGRSEDLYKFKTPGLRNVSLTAPYMHNGVFKTLDEVVEFYNQGNAIHAYTNKPPLNLSRYQKKALVAFLKSLTDSRIPIY